MTTQELSILLMDEDAEILEQLQTTLQREGYHVQVAVDGHAALRLARNTKPHLIVSDLLLAGLDGYEVWQILRSDKEMPPIPILIVSALAVPPPDTPWRPNPNAEWRLLTYEAFLPKPVDLRRLVRVANKLLYPETTQAIPGGPSVIVVIEDAEVQSALAGILAQHDFEVETPDSLDKALQLLTAVPPAVLIVDYRQNNAAANQIIAQSKKVAPNTVVILIVDPSQQIDSHLLRVCDGFIGLPLFPTQTVATLNQALDRCSMARRTALLSNQLITTNRDLVDTQHVLRAQNEELQHANIELRKLDSMKEMLTGMVVHDLRTPLAAIFGTLSYLTTDPDLDLSDTSEYLLTGAMAAAKQMVRLTETLLEGQRLEQGHFRPDKEPFDFEIVVDDSLSQVASLITIHQQKSEVQIPEELPLVYADPHLCQRILENLLDNAIKFSPRGGTVTVRAVADGNFIKVSIEDTGPGIPKERQAEIFEQFAQLKNSEEPSGRGGFGLGLTFCQLAVQAMGGSIWVESDGQSGTTFIFTVPLYQGDE
ncbi:MAG: ATP-binding protein [Chloroflexota bacterium]